MHLIRPLAVVVIALAAPVAGAAQDRIPNALDSVRFAPSLNVDLARASLTWSGAYIRDLASGRGAAANQGTTVTVRWRAWLPNGATVGGDSAHIDTFRVGAGVVTPGLDQGVSGMRVGGRRQIVVPPHAQGLDGIPGVPPDMAIVFDVELVRTR